MAGRIYRKKRTRVQAGLIIQKQLQYTSVMLLWIALTSLAIMLTSLSGVVIVWSGAGDWLEDRLEFITSLAAGVFLVVAVKLIRHTLHETDKLWEPLLFIVIGALLIYALLRLVPGFHHHCQGETCEHHLNPTGILTGDAIHNIGDGLLLAASFQVSTIAGITAGIAVLIHEIVQEISEFFVLKASGFSTARALIYNFIVSSTIIIGAVGGYIATTQAQHLDVPLLSLAAGSFLVVIAHDFIPHSARHTKNRNDLLYHAGWFLSGLIIMTAAHFVVGH